MITAILIAALARPTEPNWDSTLALVTAPAPITIRVDAKPGDSIRGTRSFRVLVDTDETVNQVEFYVNGTLRKSDESSPYDFELNTLDEADGALKIKFIAYTSLSHKATKELTVTVDNQISLGADAHVKRGLDDLTNGKWDEAIEEGRIALKVTANYVPARVVLARAFLGKGIIDEALNQAQQAATASPNDPAVLDLEAGIELHQAFNTFNTGGSREDTLHAIRDSMSVAVNARRKILDATVDAAKLDPASPVPYADIAIRAARYSAAISALAPVFKADNRRVDVGNRLAFAQLRSLRLDDAWSTVQTMLRFGKPDAYTYALQAVLAYERGDATASDAAIAESKLNDISNVGGRTAEAYIALRRNRTNTLTRIAGDLSKDEGQRTEVAYFLSALYNRTSDFQNSRKYFEQALLIEPTNADVYIEQANRSIQIALNSNLGDPNKPDPKKETQFQLEQAASYFEIARQAQPSSPQALTGLAIVAMLQGRSLDAFKYGEAASQAGPEYVSGLYAFSGALQRQSTALMAAASANRAKANGGDSKAAELKQQAADWERQASQMSQLQHDLLIRAGKLDPMDLGNREAPTPQEALAYYSRHGQAPVMAAP